MERISPRLDVRDLELVLALASSRSTVRAAATLHVTQSAVSRGLLVAEDKLGARLFDRTPRGLVPTPAGERLVGGAGRLLAQLAALESDVVTPAEEPARIRLACECYTAYRWLPSTLVALRQTMPRLEVSLAFEHSGAPVAALTSGAIDVALLTTARPPASIVQRELFSDEIVFVVARNHPLASQKAIDRSALLAHPWIVSTQTPDAERRWFVQRVFGRSRPRVDVLRFPLTEAIVDAARAGMGIAILSEWMASPYAGDGELVVRRLRGRALRRPWRIAFQRDVERSARTFAAAIESAAPRLAG